VRNTEKCCEGRKSVKESRNFTKTKKQTNDQTNKKPAEKNNPTNIRIKTNQTNDKYLPNAVLEVVLNQLLVLLLQIRVEKQILHAAVRRNEAESRFRVQVCLLLLQKLVEIFTCNTGVTLALKVNQNAQTDTEDRCKNSKRQTTKPPKKKNYKHHKQTNERTAISIRGPNRRA
jgi:hypothetical protein